MLTHKKLILLFLFIILAIVLILHNQKNKSNQKEYFSGSHQEFIKSIYGLNMNKDNEICASVVGGTQIDLEGKKDNLVNARLCYKKDKYNQSVPSGQRFINKINLERNRNDINATGTINTDKNYIRSKSDYLGCYAWKGNTDNLTGNKYFDPLPQGNDKVVNNNNYNTLNNIKSNNNTKKIFMSGEIRDEMQNMSHSTLGGSKKSIGGPLTEGQFHELKKHRVPDKYCLGRRDLNSDFRVKNYLGGVGTVAIYKNNTYVTPVDEPKLFMRDRKISQSEGCEDHVSLNCAIEFKKHVLAEFNFNDLYYTDASEFDRDTIPIKKIFPIEGQKIFDTFKNEDEDNKNKRLLFLDRSGNENHMILDYNYLNFLGSFDIRNNFTNIKEYNDWLTDREKFKTKDIKDLFEGKNLNKEDNKLHERLNKSDTLIISRYKDINNTQKAKYYVTNNKEINSEIITVGGRKRQRKIFCENWSRNILKFDSMVIRGTHNIWPYMGMIGWWKDQTKYENWEPGNNKDSNKMKPIVLKEYPAKAEEAYGGNMTCGKRIEFKGIESTIPGLRKDFSLDDFRTSHILDNNRIMNPKTNFKSDERIYWLESSNLDKGSREKCWSSWHGFSCEHLRCLNYSYLKDIHHYENPNPLYISVSKTLTRRCFRHFNFEVKGVLNLNTQPKQETLNGDKDIECVTPEQKEGSTNENYIPLVVRNNNNFFMRGSNKLMNELRDEYAFIMDLERKESQPGNNSLHSINKLESKYPVLRKKKNSSTPINNICGNPILSISANFKNIYDKNEVKFYGEEETEKLQKTSNQAFLWCYMHNYNNTNNRNNRKDGLVYTIPKKVKSIGFSPNNKRLCVSKITVYNKDGRVINTYLKKVENKADTELELDTGQRFSRSKRKQTDEKDIVTIDGVKYIKTSNFKLYRKDEELAYDDDKYLISKNYFENENKSENSFCFTCNPIKFIKKCYLGGRVYPLEKDGRIDKKEAELGYLDGRVKNKINSNNTKKPYEAVGCYLNDGKIRTYHTEDMEYKLYGRVGHNSNLEVANEIITQKEPREELSREFYTKEQNIPTEHKTPKTMDECMNLTKNIFRSKGQLYFGMEDPKTRGPLRAACLTLPEIPKLYDLHPCEPGFNLLPDGTCQDNKYLFKTPNNQCRLEGHMDGNYGLGSANRLQIYKINEIQSPPIRVAKTSKNNGGVTYVDLNGKMDEKIVKVKYTSSGGVTFKKHDEDNGFIEIEKFRPTELRNRGIGEIFVSPLNERLKGDSISNERPKLMAIQYGTYQKDGKVVKGDKENRYGSITEKMYYEDRDLNFVGRPHDFQWLPFEISEKVKGSNIAMLKLNKRASTDQNKNIGQIYHGMKKKGDPNHKVIIFPKLQIPATKDDFYLIELEKPDYVSRIVVECGIKEAVTHPHDVEKEDEYFFESTINSVIKEQFENTDMFLFDEDNTDKKILEKTEVTDKEGNPIKRIRSNFDINKVSAINSVNFKTIYQNEKEIGFDDKNATVDFYNVGFIHDGFSNQANEGNKSVAIICENKPGSNGREKQLYLKTRVGNQIRVTGNPVSIPNDFIKYNPGDVFQKISVNKNYNYKIGNLFNNFSDVKLKNFKILGKSFFEDNRKKLKPSGYTNPDEYTPGPMINKILDNYRASYYGRNQYSTVARFLDNKIKDDDNFKKEMNILKFLNTKNEGQRDYPNVDGTFISYETDKSRGFSELNHTPAKDSDTIIPNLLYAPKIPIE